MFAVRHSLFSRLIRILLATLATLLIISGIAFILFTTSLQYDASAKAFTFSQAQATRNVLGATSTSVQGTANAISTTQSNINATATAIDTHNLQATATIEMATATATYFSGVYLQATKGTPALDNPLTSNDGAGKWDEGSSATNTGCSFEGGYKVQEASRGFLQPCIARDSNFSNFTYQVEVSISQGFQAQAGILFCVNSNNTNYYFFHIGTDNTYKLDLYQGENQIKPLAQGNSSAIETGLGQSNKLTVIVRNKTYQLFINGAYVGSVSDSTLSEGKIGVGVINNSTPVVAVFSDAKVWQANT
jgi:hypothetical protein